MKQIVVISPVLVCAAASASAQRSQAIVIAQPGSPIEIAKYMAAYQPRTQYSPEGIRHSVSYTNKSEKPVQAIRFGQPSKAVPLSQPGGSV